jgi:hypothetical protein
MHGGDTPPKKFECDWTIEEDESEPEEAGPGSGKLATEAYLCFKFVERSCKTN